VFRKNYTVKINLPGGIVAAGELYAIIEAAERAKVVYMQLGTRQQLFCKVTDKYGSAFMMAYIAVGRRFLRGQRRQIPQYRQLLCHGRDLYHTKLGQ